MSDSVVFNTKNFDSKIKTVVPKLINSASSAVGKAGDELLKLSGLVVPVKTGLLKSTGNVSKAKLEASVSYQTPYAVAVHERPGKKSKYLERPFNSNFSKFMGIIADEIKKGLK